MPEQSTLATPPPAIRYGLLKQCHPERRAGYLRRLWAFYQGGHALLGDAGLMAEIFPPHRREIESVYFERLRRAFFIGVAGEILDQLVSTVMSDPIRVGQEVDKIGGATTSGWYSDFLKNVAPLGAPAMNIAHLLSESIRSLLVTRESWVRVDMPAAGEYASLGDQEKSGGLNPWLVPIPSECVHDWKADERDRLEWVLTHTCDTPRTTILDERKMVVERWCYYDASWTAEYKIEHKPDDPIKDDAEIPLVKSVAHRFGVVPIVRQTVPNGLWAMDTLESMQREHFNKRNALAWGEIQSLLPELYEFCGPEHDAPGVVVGENQKDAARATSQPRGQGYVQIRGAEDRAEFVGPPVEPFVEARKSVAELRDEMKRVMHLMALSVANTASMMGRSAASKKQDKDSTNIVAKELGRYLRDHAVAIMEMVSAGRQDAKLKGTWKATGASEFNQETVDEVVERAVQLEGVTIKSPTFHRIHQAATAETVLAERATPEVMEEIEKELEENVTAEDMAPVATREALSIEPGDDSEDDGDDSGEADDVEDKAESKPAKKPKVKSKAPKNAAPT